MNKRINMSQTTGIVFIHGAGLGSWIWKDVTAQLDMPTLAVDFPNRENTTNTNKNLSLDDYAQNAISQVDTFNADKLVIVAHSIGGVVGLKLAEHYQDKLVGFIGISAAIPNNGGSYMSCLPLPMRLMVSIMMKLSGTKPPKGVIAKGLCSGLTEAQTDKIVSKFTPESLKLYSGKCSAAAPDTKNLYVKLINDKAFAPSLQDKSINNMNPHKTVQMDTGHLPMLASPGELAGIISNFVAA